LSIITTFNIRNYSIFLREPENLLFSYFEYHGSDFAKDMAYMATDPRTQAWWKVCGPCQQPLPT
jgi:L-rhamnose mutarotase